MTHTRWRDNFRTVVPNRALAYGRNASGVLEQQTPIENIIGAGGLLTNVSDLLLWNENFTHAKVGGQEIVRLQQTPVRLTTGATISYAAGLTITTTDGIREVSHGGSTGGYRTWLARFPDQNVSIAVLCNSAQANPAKLGHDTARLWTGAVEKSAAAPQQQQPPDGLYRNLRDNTAAEVRWQNGKLSIGANAPPRYRFEPGPPVRIRVMTPDDEVLYELVERVQPTANDLAALLGEYDSKETGTALKIRAGDKPGELMLTIAANAPMRLRPTFRDAFATPTGSSIYFIRDASGNVTSLSAGESRVWDLRFTRIR
jgi:hypothetical protein